MMLATIPNSLNARTRLINQGRMPGMGALPFGLFASGTDYTGWTWKEWAVVGIGGWFLLKRK